MSGTANQPHPVTEDEDEHVGRRLLPALLAGHRTRSL
jgi:hypothetical protein